MPKTKLIGIHRKSSQWNNPAFYIRPNTGYNQPDKAGPISDKYCRRICMNRQSTDTSYDGKTQWGSCQLRETKYEFVKSVSIKFSSKQLLQEKIITGYTVSQIPGLQLLDQPDSRKNPYKMRPQKLLCTDAVIARQTSVIPCFPPGRKRGGTKNPQFL